MGAIKPGMLLFVAGLALFLGVSGGYVLGNWRTVTQPSGQSPKIFGIGTELIDTLNDPSGAPFDLISTFAFTEEFFHCVVVTNDRPFVFKTYRMGTVEIGKNQFFMSVDSVRVDQVRKANPRRVEIKGLAKSITRVGDKYEEALVPFSAVAVDGGPGNKGDSLVLTVYYDEKSAPMQLAVFGPEPRFGTAANIRSGGISIAPGSEGGGA